jgi:nicotinamide-nucleotide amidase
MRATQVLADLALRGETIACAESLTGGSLMARLVDVPGASRVLRGGVVAYAHDVKAVLLGVPVTLLATRGAVDPDVAIAMAAGACRVFDTDWGVATTGVAGPDPSDGKRVGTAYIALVRVGSDPIVRELHLDGERTQIRSAVVEAALELIDAALTTDDTE